EFVFLRLPPGPPQPGGWHESGVEQGNDGDRRQREADLNGRLGGEGGREDGGQQEGNDGKVSETERAHPGALHYRPSPSGEPESNARFAHAATPDEDERGGGDQLEPLGGAAPEDRLDRNLEQAGCDYDADDHAQGARLERDDRMPE